MNHEISTLDNVKLIVSAWQVKLNRIFFLLEVLDLICLWEGFDILKRHSRAGVRWDDEAVFYTFACLFPA